MKTGYIQRIYIFPGLKFSLNIYIFCCKSQNILILINVEHKI